MLTVKSWSSLGTTAVSWLANPFRSFPNRATEPYIKSFRFLKAKDLPHLKVLEASLHFHRPRTHHLEEPKGSAERRIAGSLLVMGCKVCCMPSSQDKERATLAPSPYCLDQCSHHSSTTKVRRRKARGPSANPPATCKEVALQASSAWQQKGREPAEQDTSVSRKMTK